MSRTYPNETVTFTLTNNNEHGTPVAATSISFESRLNENEKVTAQASDITNPSTGVYQTNVTPSACGALRSKWTVTTSDVTTVKLNTIKVHEAI